MQRHPNRCSRDVYRRQQTAPFVDRMLAYDWRFTLADNDLPKVSGTTRLAGIDVGYPLLSDALVDLSTALGTRDKVRGLRLRHFFKESLADFLPPEIIAKKKHGFGLPVGSLAGEGHGISGPGARSLIGSLAERRLVQRRPRRRPVLAPAGGASRLLRRDGLGPDDARAVAAAHAPRWTFG